LAQQKAGEKRSMQGENEQGFFLITAKGSSEAETKTISLNERLD